MTQWITVAKIGAPHGIKGALKVFSYCQPAEQILTYSPLFLSAEHPIPLKIRHFQAYNHDFLIELENIDDRNAAAKLTHQLLVIDAKQLPILEPDQFYWSQLEGLQVINLQNECLGSVTKLFEAGQTVLDVSGSARYLIPFVMPDIIKSVNLEAKQIIVDWHVDDTP